MVIIEKRKNKKITETQTVVNNKKTNSPACEWKVLSWVSSHFKVLGLT